MAPPREILTGLKFSPTKLNIHQSWIKKSGPRNNNGPGRCDIPKSVQGAATLLSSLTKKWEGQRSPPFAFVIINAFNNFDEAFLHPFFKFSAWLWILAHYESTSSQLRLKILFVFLDCAKIQLTFCWLYVVEFTRDRIKDTQMARAGWGQDSANFLKIRRKLRRCGRRKDLAIAQKKTEYPFRGAKDVY